MNRGEPTKRLREAGWVWLWGLLIAGGAAFAFAWLGSEVLERDAFSWDTSILIALHNLHTPWLDTVMISITNIGLPGGTIITIVVALWLWFRYQRLAALVLVISFSGAWLLYTGLKLLYARPRPTLLPPLSIPHDYSFPSGHALTAVSLYGFIALLLWQEKRIGLALLSLLPIVLISLSRVYIGVHYPTDILGALAVGVIWLAAVFAGYRVALRLRPPHTG